MKAVYMAANTAEEQVDQVSTLLANGNAAGVVIYALDIGASSGEMELYSEGVPFISFDGIIEETKIWQSLTIRAIIGRPELGLHTICRTRG